MDKSMRTPSPFVIFFHYTEKSARWEYPDAFGSLCGFIFGRFQSQGLSVEQVVYRVARFLKQVPECGGCHAIPPCISRIATGFSLAGHACFISGNFSHTFLVSAHRMACASAGDLKN